MENSTNNPITPQQFAKTIKEKYPQYKDVDDIVLAKKMIEKYPEYKSKVSFDQPVKKKEASVSVSNLANGNSSSVGKGQGKNFRLPSELELDESFSKRYNSSEQKFIRAKDERKTVESKKRVEKPLEAKEVIGRKKVSPFDVSNAYRDNRSWEKLAELANTIDRGKYQNFANQKTTDEVEVERQNKINENLSAGQLFGSNSVPEQNKLNDLEVAKLNPIYQQVERQFPDKLKGINLTEFDTYLNQTGLIKDFNKSSHLRQTGKYDEEKEVVNLLDGFVAWKSNSSIRDMAINQARLMLNNFQDEETRNATIGNYNKVANDFKSTSTYVKENVIPKFEKYVAEEKERVKEHEKYAKGGVGIKSKVTLENTFNKVNNTLLNISSSAIRLIGDGANLITSGHYDKEINSFTDNFVDVLVNGSKNISFDTVEQSIIDNQKIYNIDGKTYTQKSDGYVYDKNNNIVKDIDLSEATSVTDNKEFNPIGIVSEGINQLALVSLSAGTGSLAPYFLVGYDQNRQSYLDAFPDATTAEAVAYATTLSSIELLSERILPSSKYFEIGAGKAILGAIKGVGKESRAKALEFATKNYLTTVLKENATEVIPMLAQFGIDNAINSVKDKKGFNAEWSNDEMISTLAVTTAFSGLLGLRNANHDYKSLRSNMSLNDVVILSSNNLSVKNEIDGMLNDKTVQDYLGQDVINQFNEKRLTFEKYKDKLPSTTTYEQFEKVKDLLDEKEQLKEKRKNLDENFRDEIDQQLTELDAKIKSVYEVKPKEEVSEVKPKDEVVENPTQSTSQVNTLQQTYDNVVAERKKLREDKLALIDEREALEVQEQTDETQKRIAEIDAEITSIDTQISENKTKGKEAYAELQSSKQTDTVSTKEKTIEPEQEVENPKSKPIQSTVVSLTIEDVNNGKANLNEEISDQQTELENIRKEYGEDSEQFKSQELIVNELLDYKNNTAFSNGEHSLRFDNENKPIVTTESGKIANETTKRKVIKEAISEGAFDQSERVLDREGLNMESEGQVIDYVIQNSQNPTEIAETITQQKEIDDSNNTRSDVETKIAEKVRNKSVKKSSFIKFGDKNQIDKRIDASYLSKNGKGLDEIAMEVETELYGDYNANQPRVTEQDVVDFILNNPSSREYWAKHESSEMQSLKENFEKYSGIPATNENLALFTNRQAENQTEVETENLPINDADLSFDDFNQELEMVYNEEFDDDLPFQKGNQNFRKLSQKAFGKLVRQLKKAFGGKNKIITTEAEFKAKLKELGLSESEIQFHVNRLQHKEKQLLIINKTNPAPNEYNTWVRSVDDILTAEEAFKNAFEDGEMYPDFTTEDMQNAINSGKVTVYSSYPIKDGNFVTPSLMNAKDYAGGGKVYSKIIKLDEVAWIDESEGQYAKVQFMRTSTGNIFGAIFPDGTIYIDQNNLNANTPIHEYGHLWTNLAKEQNPEVYKQVLEIVKQDKQAMDEVRNDSAYSHLTTDEQIAEEVLARQIGNIGEQNYWAKKDAGLVSKIKNAINDLFEYIKGIFGKSTPNVHQWTVEQFQNATLQELAEGVSKDLLSGKQLFGEGLKQNNPLSAIQYSLLKETDFDANGNVKPEVLAEIQKEREVIIAQAKADGTYLKADNGNTSKLNEDQWVTVRTKRFKNWFGDWQTNPENASKVVDENGEPLVVYHSTNEEFTSFDLNKKGENTNWENTDLGFFFTDNETLKVLKEQNEGTFGDIEMPSFLNIKNPFDLHSLFKDGQDKIVAEYLLGEELDQDQIDEFIDDIGLGEIEQVNEAVYSEEFSEILKENGYDGFIGKLGEGFEYIAREPNQIKSATNNAGTFSTQSNNIQLSSQNNNQGIAPGTTVNLTPANTNHQVPTKLPEKLHKKIVELMRDKMENYKTTKQVIDVGLDYLKKQEWYKNLNQEEKNYLETNLIKHLKIGYEKTPTQKPRAEIEAEVLRELAKNKSESTILPKYKNSRDQRIAKDVIERERTKNKQKKDVVAEVEKVFKDAEDAQKAKINVSVYFKRMIANIRKNFVDNQGKSTKLLVDGGLKVVRNYIHAERGATGKAKEFYDSRAKKIYKGLSSKDVKILNRIIMLRRIIQIDKDRASNGDISKDHKINIKRDKKGNAILDNKGEVVHMGFLNQEKAEIYLEHLENTLGSQQFNKLNERTEMYFDAHKEMLNLLEENGVISSELKDKLISLDYQRREYIDFMKDEDGNYLEQNSTESKKATQAIQSLTDGYDGFLVTDSEYLFSRTAQVTMNAIARNNTMLSLQKEMTAQKNRVENLKSKNPKDLTRKEKAEIKYFEQLEKQVTFDKKEAGRGFVEINYTDQGEKKSVFMKQDFADSFRATYVASKWDIVYDVLGVPSKILKMVATGNNPTFFIVNTPRDIFTVATLSNEYGNNLLLNLFNISVGSGKNAGKMLIDRGMNLFGKDYQHNAMQKYIEYGGSMEMLNTQGDIRRTKLFDLITQRLDRRTVNTLEQLVGIFKLQAIQDASEMGTRLAVFERGVKNRFKKAGVKNEAEFRALHSNKTDFEVNQLLKDIYTSAVVSARDTSDFAQKGEAYTAMETFIPYFNASVQAKRFLYDSMKNDPAGTSSKILQGAVLASGGSVALGMMLLAMNLKDDDEDKKLSSIELYLKFYKGVSDYDKESYFNIPIGKNDKGEFDYFRIAKSQDLTPFFSLTEGAIISLMKMQVGDTSDTDVSQHVWKTMSRNWSPLEIEIDKGNIFKNTMGSISTNMRKNPLLKGIITYKTGYDFFRDQPLSFKNGKIDPLLEGYEKGSKVEEFYKVLGDSQNDSPVRMKAFVESLVTTPSTNPYVGMLYGGADYIFAKEETKEKKMFNDYIKKSFSGRVFKETNEFNREKKIDEATENMILENNREKLKKDAKMGVIADEVIAGNMSKNDAFKEIENSFDNPKDIVKQKNKLNEQLSNKNVSRFVFDVKREFNSKNKAILLMHLYGKDFNNDAVLDDKQKAIKRDLIRMKAVNNDARIEYNKLINSNK